MYYQDVQYKFVVIPIREAECRTDRHVQGSWDLRCLNSKKDEEKEAESILKDVLRKSIKTKRLFNADRSING
jgi:hypothetical protein